MTGSQLLRLEIPSGMCARQKATIEILRRNFSYYCLLALRLYIFVLRAHPVRGESHNQWTPPERLQHNTWQVWHAWPT